MSNPTPPPPREGQRHTPGICPACGSDKTRWSAAVTRVNGCEVADGRLRMHEVKPVFVLGCERCSETVEVIDAESPDGEEMLNVCIPDVPRLIEAARAFLAFDFQHRIDRDPEVCFRHMAETIGGLVEQLRAALPPEVRP